MTTQSTTRLVHEGDYLAEVTVELLVDEGEEGGGWGPYLSPRDVKRLDEVRIALRQKDLRRATALARVYHLVPVNAA